MGRKKILNVKRTIGGSGLIKVIYIDGDKKKMTFRRPYYKRPPKNTTRSRYALDEYIRFWNKEIKIKKIA